MTKPMMNVDDIEENGLYTSRRGKDREKF